MHNFDLGKREQNPWGQAISIFQTPAKKPYYQNLHQTVIGRKRIGEKDPGNAFICGMTGTGKSVLLGFVVSQLTKVPGLCVLFFDKDRGTGWRQLSWRVGSGVRPCTTSCERLARRRMWHGAWQETPRAGGATRQAPEQRADHRLL